MIYNEWFTAIILLLLMVVWVLTIAKMVDTISWGVDYAEGLVDYLLKLALYLFCIIASAALFLIYWDEHTDQLQFLIKTFL